jgi:hypothetical protein
MPRTHTAFTFGKRKVRRMRALSHAIAGPVPYKPDLRDGGVLRVALAAAVLFAAIWVALPAYASCSNGASIGWKTTGSVIRGSQTVTCNPEFVTYARIRTQEKVGPVWGTVTWSQWSGNSHGVSGFADANCAGHGQDLWRAQAYYESSTAGSGTNYAPGSQGHWFNCP